MTMTATTTATRPESTRPAGSYDRLFYSTMAIAMAVTVFAGFSPTYYLRLFDGGPRSTLSGGPFTALVHMHAALFTAWVCLFVVQTLLVAGRRVSLHRRLGAAGAVLAAVMVVVGTSAAIATVKRGAAPPGVDPLAFLIIPLGDMVLFAGFVTAAVVLRRNREAHKRLMLLAYASILVAAVARLPGMVQLGPPAFFGVALLFIVAGAAYDLFSRGRIHKVYLYGGGLFALSVPARLAFSGTDAWREIALTLIR
jgi:hypothetical protein